MKRLLVLGLSLGLVGAMAAPVSAGGPVDKVTGSGAWVNGDGGWQTVTFNAHEGDGTRPAKGMLYQENAFGSFTVDVVVAIVTEEGACFGGPQVHATGSFVNYAGRWRWTTVLDGGAGPEETGADYLRGLHVVSSSLTPPLWCSTYDIAQNKAWWDGNVQIHLGGSHNDAGGS